MTTTLSPNPRGYSHPGGGLDTYMRAPQLLRATTNQVKGLYPWAAGSGTPLVGVPLGKTLRDYGAATVCADPISWFERAHLISNPSAFVLGLPALGKSTLVRRMCTVLAAWGTHPWVLGDVKGEYRDLIRGLGGQVITLGRGRGYLNVLDITSAESAAERIGGEAGAALLADARARRQNAVEALITVQRGTEPTDHESALLGVALGLLDQSSQNVNPPRSTKGTLSVRKGVAAPVLGDLLAVITARPTALKEAALWRNKLENYYAATDGLVKSLHALTLSSGFGAVFSQPTTVPLRIGSPAVFDLSGVDEGDHKLRSALLLSCWSVGFGEVAVSHALADAGLAPAERVLIVMDELWSALRAGTGLVDRVDALGRLNRDKGVGTVMVSHTMDDLKALPTEQDRRKAAGLVERAGMLLCAGLPRSEMPRLQDVMRFTAREQDELVSWSTPSTWSSVPNAQGSAPPGRGRFMVKVGGRPGIPFELVLTAAERAVNNTNKRWEV